MPIYEFKCERCLYVFEKLIFRKDEIIFCPKCRRMVRSPKLLSLTADRGASWKKECGTDK